MAEARPLRAASHGIDVRRVRFAQGALSGGKPFAAELRGWLGDFSKLVSVELQITGIASSSAGLASRIRYEFVGTGQGFYREQRTGEWALDWERDAQGGYRVVKWAADEETGPGRGRLVFRM